MIDEPERPVDEETIDMSATDVEVFETTLQKTHSWLKEIMAVFRVLGRRISEGEIQDIKDILPDEIRRLWT